MEHDKSNGKQIKSAAGAADIFRGVIDEYDENDKHREHFWVMGLNIQNKILYVECISTGNVDSSIVDPREVFRTAIARYASKILVSHNHPSGALDPSPEDIAVTKNLCKAGKILNLPVIDHVIITYDGYCSFKEENLM